MLLQKHFGSAYAMADYSSQSHNVYFSATYMPIPSLQFTGSVNFNMSKGELDPVIFPDVRAALTADTLSHQDFTFDEMHTYSDLNYSLVELGFGVAYQVGPRVALTANAEYADLTDDTGYVYGLESGSYYMIRTGVRIDF